MPFPDRQVLADALVYKVFDFTGEVHVTESKLYDALADLFQLSDEERSMTYDAGAVKWDQDIRMLHQSLKKKGIFKNIPKRGWWGLSEEGIALGEELWELVQNDGLEALVRRHEMALSAASASAATESESAFVSDSASLLEDVSSHELPEKEDSISPDLRGEAMSSDTQEARPEVGPVVTASLTDQSLPSGELDLQPVSSTPRGAPPVIDPKIVVIPVARSPRGETPAAAEPAPVERNEVVQMSPLLEEPFVEVEESETASPSLDATPPSASNTALFPNQQPESVASSQESPRSATEAVVDQLRDLGFEVESPDPVTGLGRIRSPLMIWVAFDADLWVAEGPAVPVTRNSSRPLLVVAAERETVGIKHVVADGDTLLVNRSVLDLITGAMILPRSILDRLVHKNEEMPFRLDELVRAFEATASAGSSDALASLLSERESGSLLMQLSGIILEHGRFRAEIGESSPMQVEQLYWHLMGRDSSQPRYSREDIAAALEFLTNPVGALLKRDDGYVQVMGTEAAFRRFRALGHSLPGA